MARSALLVEWILSAGLGHFEPPTPLPPITEAVVRPVCWMAVQPEA